MAVGDAKATRNLAGCYAGGRYDLRRNMAKAMKLWHRAGELGCTEAYCRIGYSYDNGSGVERNEKKAKYYYELAAIRGNVPARYNLGISEEDAGNVNRAMKHWMILQQLEMMIL